MGDVVSFVRKQQSRLAPAKAGTQAMWTFLFWIPAFAGMTPLPRPIWTVTRPLPPPEKRTGGP